MTRRRVHASEYRTVNEGIAHLPESGGEVIVDDPVVVTEPVRIDRNLVFRGVGRAHHSQAPGGLGAKLSLPEDASHPMFTYEADVRYCTWESLVLDGNRRNGATGAAIVAGDHRAMYPTLARCFFDQWGDDIVSLERGYGLQIFGSTLEGMAGHAVALSGLDRCRISHSYFAIGGSGHTFIDASEVTNLVVQGNYARDAGEHALHARGCDGIVTNGNEFNTAGKNVDGASVVRLADCSRIIMSGDLVHADSDSSAAIRAESVRDGKIDVLHGSGPQGGLRTDGLSNVHTAASVHY